MKTFSLEARLEGRRAVVVGACGECAMKIERLLEAGAEVTVFVEGATDPRIEAWANAGAIRSLRRALDRSDLAGVMLAYVSPTLDCPPLLMDWEAEGHLLCHLDRPERGSFINPASTRGGTVRFTISTAGKAPALARRLRERLDDVVTDPRLEAFVQALSAIREETPSAERRAVLNDRLDGLALKVAITYPSWFTEPHE